MMLHRSRMLVLYACIALGACRFPGVKDSPKAPDGQVVATVNGQEITIRELNAELGDTNITDARQRKAAEQSALQSIINRKLLAQSAHTLGFDKTPDYAIQKRRADEIVLAGGLQKKVAEAIPQVSREEALNYVSSHPTLFANRRIYTVDQIHVQAPITKAQAAGLQPLDTLDQIETYLTQQKVPYHRGPGELDTENIDPRLADGISRMSPNQVFALPSTQGLILDRIQRMAPQPITGDDAFKIATTLLTRQHIEEALSKQLGGLRANPVNVVSYNAAYQPPPAASTPPANPAAPAPAKPAAAPPAPAQS